jgi:hypothetical protein
MFFVTSIYPQIPVADGVAPEVPMQPFFKARVQASSILKFKYSPGFRVVTKCMENLVPSRQILNG